MSPAIDALWQALHRHARLPLLQHGSRHWSGQAILDTVSERVLQLQHLGARRVALALDNGAEWILWDLALLASGCINVPLPGFFSTAQQQHVLDSAGIDLAIGLLPTLAAQTGFVPLGGECWQRAPEQVPAVHPGTAKITYTSGTTGQPKGVCLDAHAQLRVAKSLYQASRPCEVKRHLCVLPLATLLENIAGVYAPLLAGACINVRPMAEIGLHGSSEFDLLRFMTTLRDSQPNSLILLPQLLLALVTAAERGLSPPRSLRFIAVGGGHVAPQLLQRADALGLPVFEGYGLSECASVVTLNTPGARRAGSSGQTLPHADIRLASDGEVMIRGVHMLGYLGEAPHPDGWLASGDLGQVNAGFLTLHGRKKNQFVTAFGRNVNPEWVEAELVQQAPIAQAWLYGEAMPRNVAVLVPRFEPCPDETLTAAVAAVNAGLPDYARAHHWLRADARFTAANGLATSNGRLRRDALATHYHNTLSALLTTPTSEALP
jgi:long-chain acyl-CoA synthetase